MIRRVILLASVVLALPAMLLAADWPRFRGPNGNGIAPETGINKAWSARPPRLLWKVPMGDKGFAGPAVAGGRVYIVDHQGSNDVVRALDLRTGKDAWRFTYADTNRENYGFARATPTVAGGRVYTLSRLGLLHCLDAASGKKVWAQDIVRAFGGKRPQWDLATSPLLDGNKLIVCPGGPNAAVAALDAKTGKTLWKGGGSDVAGYATPVPATLNGKRQYLVFTGFNLIGVDAANGKLLWSFPWKTQYDVNAATPIPIGNSVFITSGYGHGCALIDVTGGRAKARWQSKEIQSQFNTPVYSGGYIYSTSDPGNLVCLDPKSGRAVWKQRGFEKGGLIAVDGALVVVDGAKGDVALVAMTPSGYKELGRVKPLGGQSWAPPVVADGKLLVRNKQFLACLALK